MRLAAAALLTQWLGSRGLVLAGAVSGLGDVHASAISAASLSLSGNVELSIAAYAVLAGLSANAISKTIVAFSLGGQKFGWTLLPGILLPVATSWLALYATHLLR